MTLYAVVDGNRLDIRTDADGQLTTLAGVVVTGPTTVLLPVVDYGRPWQLAEQQRPAPELWDAVIDGLGYTVTGEWHAQNVTIDRLLWHAAIDPFDGLGYTVAGNPPVLTITGAATIGHVLELLLNNRVRIEPTAPRVAIVT